jgi:acetyltransferase-like isoleucine patch superfamily enzyme
MSLAGVIARVGGTLLTVPMRLMGARLGPGVMVGPGYSILGVTFRGVELQRDVAIGARSWIQTIPQPGKPAPAILIREGTKIGRQLTISAAGRVEIGRDCVISYQVSFLDHHHITDDPVLPPTKTGLTEPRPIVIGDGCFIGAHSFILPGVVLGNRCVVGANSVVTQSFPDGSILAGSPAKLVRRQSFLEAGGS